MTLVPEKKEQIINGRPTPVWCVIVPPGNMFVFLDFESAENFCDLFYRLQQMANEVVGLHDCSMEEVDKRREGGPSSSIHQIMMGLAVLSLAGAATGAVKKVQNKIIRQIEEIMKQLPNPQPPKKKYPSMRM